MKELSEVFNDIVTVEFGATKDGEDFGENAGGSGFGTSEGSRMTAMK